MSYGTITPFPRIIKSIGQTRIEYGNINNPRPTYVTFLEHPYVQKRSVFLEKKIFYSFFCSGGYFSPPPSYTTKLSSYNIIAGGRSSMTTSSYEVTPSYFTISSTYKKLSK